jgi:hypothetical protein
LLFPVEHTSGVEDPGDVWIPLVDEPIGALVAQVEQSEPEIRALVDSPRRLLAFRTFAYIRVGVLLGQLLVDSDLEPYDGSDTWVDQLMRDPAHSARVRAEVRSVAGEIAADPRYADEQQFGPDEDTRSRFREFAKRQLGD